MAGEIFSVSTSSLDSVTINNLLVAATSAIINFSAATYVSGTFQGNGSGITGITASSLTNNVTASISNTSSYSYTSSLLLGSAQFSTQSLYSTSSLYSISASWVSASVKITTADTASFITASNVVGVIGSSNQSNNSTQSIYAISSSFASSSISASYAVSASWAPGGTGIINGGSYNISSSWASASYSSSYSYTASLLLGSISSASFSTTSNTVNISSSSTNFGYAVVLAINSGSNRQLLIDGLDSLTYNPSTETMGYVNTVGTSSWSSNAINSLTSSYSITASYISSSFSRGGTFYNPSGITSGVNIIVWESQYACTVTNVKGYRVGGTSATINARKNGSLNHLASDLTLSSTDTWIDGGSVQNVNYIAGDKLEIMLVTVAGSPTQIGIQVNYKK